MVGLALGGVLAAPPTAALVLLIMIGTATWTATRRLRGLYRAGRAVVVSCVAGAAGAPRCGLRGRGASAVRALPGGRRRNRDRLARAARKSKRGWRWGPPRARPCATSPALPPGRRWSPPLDQTRTTGLVTLPGAFIGALLGGASPVQAARFQLVVLAALLAAQAVVSVMVCHLLGAPSPLPADLPSQSRP